VIGCRTHSLRVWKRFADGSEAFFQVKSGIFTAGDPQQASFEPLAHFKGGLLGEGQQHQALRRNRWMMVSSAQQGVKGK
jgi:hypothetical protein